MSKPTGGPAFPGIDMAVTGIDSDGNERTETQSCGGMTLRDYYMAHAPITVEDAMIASRIDANNVGMLGTEQRETVFRFLALLRGEYADAMVAARVTP